jgi:hypothetical protein
VFTHPGSQLDGPMLPVPGITPGVLGVKMMVALAVPARPRRATLANKSLEIRVSFMW